MPRLVFINYLKYSVLRPCNHVPQLRHMKHPDEFFMVTLVTDRKQPHIVALMHRLITLRSSDYTYQ